MCSQLQKGLAYQRTVDLLQNLLMELAYCDNSLNTFSHSFGKLDHFKDYKRMLTFAKCSSLQIVNLLMKSLRDQSFEPIL
jgi:hypothetical protein